MSIFPRFRFRSSNPTERRDRRSPLRRKKTRLSSRRATLERLEDRCLLSITVNTTIDENDGIGVGGVSLRDAIAAATPGETINFAPSLTSSGPVAMQLLHGQLVINKNLTIAGPNSQLLTINGSFASRIFDIAVGASTVEIAGLTLTGGQAAASQNGGAIRSQTTGVLTIRDCRINLNRAGNGLDGVGGSGGGIWASGPLVVDRSAITGNFAGNGNGLDGGSGGGIFSLGNLTITDSTISGNIAGLGGLGPEEPGQPGDGGGVLSSGSSVSVINSTISSNTSHGRGGGFMFSGTGTRILRSVTVTANTSPLLGGGVFNAGPTPVALNHTIVAKNVRQFATRDDVSGSFAATFSFIGDSTGATITNNGGNQIGTGLQPLDPMLRNLGNYGGTTDTHLPLPGSPVVDAGDPAAQAGAGGVPLYDQRGAFYGRVVDADNVLGAKIDIGATELGPRNWIVDTLADESDGHYYSGDLSLREAIELANLDVGPYPDSIFFSPSLLGGTIVLTMGELPIRDAVIIHGLGAANLTIDASGNNQTAANGDGSRIFNIDDEVDHYQFSATIIGLTLTGGDAANMGGAIRSLEHLTIVDSVIAGNSVTHVNTPEFGGGGIYSEDGNLTIRNSTVSGNVSTNSQGGGIQFGGGTMLIEHSVIDDNSAKYFGGGIAAALADVQITSTTISNNRSTNLVGASGGGIQLVSATATIADSLILANEAAEGAGINAWYSDTTITDTTIRENESTLGVNGGGVNVLGGQLNVERCTISDNKSLGLSEGGGGGIGTGFQDHVETIGFITDTIISNNTAVKGGGIFWGKGSLTVSGSTISHNTASGNKGGGIFAREGSLTISSSLFSENSASLGGAIAAEIGELKVSNSTITNNHADSHGGGIDSHQNNLEISSSTISGNDSGDRGGGVSVGVSTASIVNTLIADNESTHGGGVFNYGALTVEKSAVRHNFASGVGGGIANSNGATLNVLSSTVDANASNQNGGGIDSIGTLTITGSTISNNQAGVSGGAIGTAFTSANTLIVSSTISGNTAKANAGGILSYLNSQLRIRYSTIVENQADSGILGTGVGGGIFSSNSVLELDHTIVANNRRGNIAEDISASAIVPADYSLIEVVTGLSLFGTGNITGIDPAISPLADNGGPTQTHALTAGSLAVNGGNAAAAAGVGNVPVNDQRGAPFGRVFGGRLDMGAIERQPIPSAFFGDYNQNGVVDAADSVVWRNMLGQPVAPFSGADGSGNGIIDQADRAVWMANFGKTVPASSSSAGQVQPDLHEQGVLSPALPGVSAAGAPQQRTVAQPIAALMKPPAEPGPGGWSAMLGSTRKSSVVDSRPDAAAITSTAVARRDDALLAWLAARATGVDTREGENSEVLNRSGASLDDRDTRPLDEVDAVFERLAVGGA